MTKPILSPLPLIAALAALPLKPASCAEFPADKVASISAEVDAGDIRYTGLESGPLTASVEKMKDPSACRVTTEIKDKVLVLAVKALKDKKKMGMFGTSKCRADLIVSAPKALPLEAAAGNGNIVLKDGAGTLKLRTGNGSISGSVSSGDLDAASGNGSIRLDGLLGSASAKTGNGSVELSWARAPLEGKVSAKTGNGSVSLQFPDGASLTADLSTGLGSVHNDFAETKGAGLKVSASTGLGSVSVRKAK